MYDYTPTQWLFIIFFYSFMGWIWESCFVSFKKKKWVNRGFMRGPFLPIYGIGATTMVVVSAPYQDNIYLTYLSGMIGATVMEFITGVLMETLFRVRYWDYRDRFLNLKGYICLRSSLCWGFFTIMTTEMLHVQVEKIMYSIPGRALSVITILLTAVICADFALSFKAALDLRHVLYSMGKAKKEFLLIQRRLEIILAVAGNDMGRARDELVDNISQHLPENSRMEDIISSIEAKMNAMKDMILSVGGKANHLLKDSDLDEAFELRSRYAAMKQKRDDNRVHDWLTMDLVRSNPDMVSEEYSDELAEIKSQMEAEVPLPHVIFDERISEILGTKWNKGQESESQTKIGQEEKRKS